MSNSSAITLGEVADRLPMLDVACSKCDRRGRLNVAKLVEQHGASAITLYEPETVIVLSD